MGGRGLRGGPGSLPWDFSQLVDPPTHPTSDVWAKAEGARAAPSAANTNKCSLMFVSLGLSLPAPGPCGQRGAGKGPPDVVVPQPRYMPRGHRWPSPLLKGDPGAKRWLETPSGVGDGVERGEGLVGDVAPYPSTSWPGEARQPPCLGRMLAPSWQVPEEGCSAAPARGYQSRTPPGRCSMVLMCRATL